MILINRYQLAMMVIPQIFALYFVFIIFEGRFTMQWGEFVYKWLPIFLYSFVARYIVMTIHKNRKKKKAYDESPN